MSKVSIVIFLLLSALNLKAQDFFLDGYMYADSTGTPAVGVTITLNQSKRSVATNKDGYFKLPVLKGLNEVVISHINFYPLHLKLLINEDKTERFYLQKITQSLETVTITLDHKSINQTNLNGFHLLTKSDLNKTPGFLGSSDLIKSIQTLPGIGNGGEGNSALLVRGGTSGQNLVLFNDAVIYNPSHLFGFFSVFNTTAVDDVKFYKSGIPSEYGGKLSSMLDIRSNSRVADSLAGEASLSILAADVNLILPLTQKWSLSTSVRKTFMNHSVLPIINKLNANGSSVNNLAYDFYDVNISSALSLSNKDHLFMTTYLGGDQFGFEMNKLNVSNGMNWQNVASTLNWKRVFSDKAILTSSVAYSAYHFNFDIEQEGFKAGFKSALKDWNLKSTLKIYFQDHTLKTGFNYIDHTFKPNIPFAQSGNTILDYGTARTYHADQISVFASDDWIINNYLSVYSGLRFTYYRHKGPFLAKKDAVSEVVPNNKTLSDVVFIEPNISVKYQINKSSALKFDFSKNQQPIHLIPITASNFPTDLWIPSNESIKPEKGSQISLGLFQNLAKGKYEGYVDLFYKRMNNLIEFSGGIMNLLDNLEIEKSVSFGKGYAYGSEFYIKKNTGTLTGYVSYTLSKNRRIFSTINEGLQFPFKYDRTHEMSVVSNYTLNGSWDFSALFTLSTGNAFTMPLSRYVISGNVINEYGQYNAARMPSYHRLDASINYHLKPRKHFDSTVSLSVYNVYNRLNPIYNFFLANGSLKGEVSVEKKSIALLPVLPAISYKLTFK